MDGSRNSLWHINHRAWKVFNKESKLDRHQVSSLIQKAFPAVPYSEHKHINVQGTKSPYDGDVVYWSERNSKLYTDNTSKALKRQNHSCDSCGLKFIGEDKVHLNHIDGNHKNWKTKNLVAIHRSCHQYSHMSKG
jgi:hypothetical protein